MPKKNKRFRELIEREEILAAPGVHDALTGTQKGFLDRMFTRQQLYELIGYNEMLELEKRLAGNVTEK